MNKKINSILHKLFLYIINYRKRNIQTKNNEFIKEFNLINKEIRYKQKEQVIDINKYFNRKEK